MYSRVTEPAMPQIELGPQERICPNRAKMHAFHHIWTQDRLMETIPVAVVLHFI